MSFLDALATVESSSNPLAVNPVSTPSGHAEGLYQITTGTWDQFAPASVRSQYPTPLDAPVDVQTQVAGAIPLSRWAPSTLATLQSEGWNVDPTATLGQNVAFNELNPPDLSSGAQAGPASSHSFLDTVIPIPGWMGGNPATGGVSSDPGPTVAGVQAAVTAATDWQSWFVRGALFLLGACIIVVGLVMLLGQHGEKFSKLAA